MIITVEAGKSKYDIMADENSTILNTLQILTEKSMLPITKEEIPSKIYSVRRKRNVPVNEEYRENGIFQGDILRIK